MDLGRDTLSLQGSRERERKHSGGFIVTASGVEVAQEIHLFDQTGARSGISRWDRHDLVPPDQTRRLGQTVLAAWLLKLRSPEKSMESPCVTHRSASADAVITSVARGTGPCDGDSVGRPRRLMPASDERSQAQNGGGVRPCESCRQVHAGETAFGLARGGGRFLPLAVCKLRRHASVSRPPKRVLDTNGLIAFIRRVVDPPRAAWPRI